MQTNSFKRFYKGSFQSQFVFSDDERGGLWSSSPGPAVFALKLFGAAVSALTFFGAAIFALTFFGAAVFALRGFGAAVFALPDIFWCCSFALTEAPEHSPWVPGWAEHSSRCFLPQAPVSGHWPTWKEMKEENITSKTSIPFQDLLAVFIPSLTQGKFHGKTQHLVSLGLGSFWGRESDGLKKNKCPSTLLKVLLVNIHVNQ